jgi:flagellar motor switch protein FliN/FliY
VCKISFDLTVEGVIDSEIMQIYTQEMVKEISDTMLQDTAEVLEGREIMVEEIKNEELPKKESNRKVTIQQPEFSNLDNRKVESNIDNLDLLMDVPLDFSVVLGNSRKSIKDILSLGVGSVVELDKLTDEPLEVYVNSKLIAKGEVVVINENFGIRITNILSQKQRINNLH